MTPPRAESPSSLPPPPVFARAPDGRLGAKRAEGERAPASEPSSGMSPLASEPLAGTRQSTVSMAVVRGLVEAVEQAGVARADFLRAAQLDLQPPEARLPRSEVDRLCELALDLTGDPALGLHWAERLS